MVQNLEDISLSPEGIRSGAKHLFNHTFPFLPQVNQVIAHSVLRSLTLVSRRAVSPLDPMKKCCRAPCCGANNSAPDLSHRWIKSSSWCDTRKKKWRTDYRLWVSHQRNMAPRHPRPHPQPRDLSVNPAHLLTTMWPYQNPDLRALDGRASNRKWMKTVTTEVVRIFPGVIFYLLSDIEELCPR